MPLTDQERASIERLNSRIKRTMETCDHPDDRLVISEDYDTITCQECGKQWTSS